MGGPQKHIISIGMRRGHLTVTAAAGYNKHQCRMFECRCDCGEVVTIRATNFAPTKQYCSRKCRLLSVKRVKDLSGKRFGRWLVKAYAGSDDRGDAAWMCVCDCGTERVVRGFQLVDGKSQSCGCAGPEKKTLYFTPEEKLESKRRLARESNRRNPARIKACKIKYENKLSQATPIWLTKEHWAVMNAMYKEAKRLSRETGIRHEVDHIHPINGKTLSGLHVPWNLQILTQSANVAKSNRYAEHSGD
jgi:5-methylcytosine-specific restriction endonuclease McrA